MPDKKIKHEKKAKIRRAKSERAAKEKGFIDHLQRIVKGSRREN
jgi:hypothetical protein